MGLGKSKLWTKFEVTRFSHCENIEGEPQILGSFPCPGPCPPFLLRVILWWALTNPSCSPNLKSLAAIFIRLDRVLACDRRTDGRNSRRYYSAAALLAMQSAVKRVRILYSFNYLEDSRLVDRRNYDLFMLYVVGKLFSKVDHIELLKKPHHNRR